MDDLTTVFPYLKMVFRHFHPIFLENLLGIS